MNSSFQIFMTDIIDYAGLFPPARLPLSEAIDRYLAHRRGEHRWMLARFVCPVAQLAELGETLGRLGDGERPLAISILGRGGDTPEAFRSAVATDAQLMRDFASRHAGRVEIDQYETRLPGECPPERLGDEVARAFGHLDDAFSGSLLPFFETSLLGAWTERLPAAVKAIAAAAPATGEAGLKIRCGGLEAAAFPSTGALTAAIVASRRAGVPLKATQGLHHPVRHFDPTLATMMHGFINLFAAGVLADGGAVSDDRLLEVVDEEDPKAFVFSDDGLAWRDVEVGSAEISRARRRAVTSFGSCSFSEPRDDLIDLELLG